MPTVTTHTQGTFNWPELATTDQNAAKKFYSALFGWEVADQDVGPNSIYTIFKNAGRDAAALHTLEPAMREAGVPPHWGTYITVENADATAATAKALGATVVVEPFNVMEHGRMAVITDPQGATFSAWQPLQHPGVGVVAEPSSLAWTELNSKDVAGSKAFYTALIGWSAKDDPMPAELGGGHYTTWMKADGPAGGMMPMPATAPAPSHWMPYFAVADVDAAHAKAASLGALTYVPPADIPGTGRFAVVADPQGAVFALIKFNG